MNCQSTEICIILSTQTEALVRPLIAEGFWKTRMIFFLEDGSVTPSDLHKEKRFPRIKVANLNVLYNFHSIDLSEIISRGAHIQTRIPTVSNFRVISRNHFVEISVFCALKNRVIA